MIKTIILCGKQWIALRGHREGIHNSSNNCCNFLAILKLLLETNSDLTHHLDAPSPRNATYISPYIQNELIEIISYDILQKGLVEKVTEGKFFSLIADEIESHQTEQLPIYLRLVDNECNIREEFLEFGRCEQTNGESIIKDKALTLSFAVFKGTIERLIYLHKLLECKSELKIFAKKLFTPIVAVTI